MLVIVIQSLMGAVFWLLVWRDAYLYFIFSSPLPLVCRERFLVMVMTAVIVCGGERLPVFQFLTLCHDKVSLFLNKVEPNLADLFCMFFCVWRKVGEDGL